MMKNKSVLITTVIIGCVLIFLFIHSMTGRDRPRLDNKRIVNPSIGDVEIRVPTTGVVEPQNRLQLKPSISGRIEEILVKEGGQVNKGDILAWMSSTERAALVDAARSQGDEALKYWEEAYKKTPIVSPIDGEVIVRSVESGQTVSSSDAVLVLSDRLVVSAQFDETDIGRVKVGQKAIISLDAYPDVEIEGIVDHIAYESKILNNVTIYDVDIMPDDIPDILRSGMSVTVDVVEKKAKDVLTIPSSAIHYDKERRFVLVQESRGRTRERDIKVGLNNDQHAEVISGLTREDNVVVQDTIYLPKMKSLGTNPFMPERRKK